MSAVVARPHRGLWTAVVLSVVLVAASVLGYFALEPQTRARFTGLQIGTLLLFLAVMVAMMLVPATSWIRADADGVSFRNGLRVRRLPWEAVESLIAPGRSSFARLVLSPEFRTDDHDAYLILGIQAADGDRARQTVAAILALKPGR